jgi:OmpA-OmpF porin, OOP family
MRLSLERAESVRRYLIDHGVTADRLVARGYGESRPTAGNGTAGGRSANRRIEFVPLAP